MRAKRATRQLNYSRGRYVNKAPLFRAILRDKLLLLPLKTAPAPLKQSNRFGECRSTCQSACKTSCTVGNQSCERVTREQKPDGENKL